MCTSSICNNISSLEIGSNTYNYSYNADGIRISKNVNGVETQFSLDGNKIIKESRSGVTIKYTYDINGELVGFAYDGNVYVYLKNIQNDIIGIANANGDILVKYFYDANGNIIKVIDDSGISLANINPFRFKSYYYDNESGFYYLNSRYYNPVIGRCINADDISYLGVTSDFVSFDLYAYCGNNPVAIYRFYWECMVIHLWHLIIYRVILQTKYGIAMIITMNMVIVHLMKRIRF